LAGCSMIKMKITTDKDLLDEVLKHLFVSLPQTQSAVKAAAEVVQATWRGFAQGGTLPGVEKLKNPNGAYARSIKMSQVGPYSWEIVSEAEIAEWLENGTKPFDMKKTHTKGPRSRVGKPDKFGNRYPYLIVPFRWGTPGSLGRNEMGPSIYNIVSQFKKMRTLVSADESSVKTPNAAGQMVGRAQYNNDYGRLGGDGDTKGMVRTTDDTGKDRSGGYLTFRIISSHPKATGWNHPGMRARPIKRAVEEASRAAVNEIVDQGLRGDLGL